MKKVIHPREGIGEVVMAAGVHCMHIGTQLFGQVSHLHKLDHCSLCDLLNIRNLLRGTAHLPSVGFQCSGPQMRASLALVRSAPREQQRVAMLQFCI